MMLLFYPPREHGAKVLVVMLDAIGDFVIWLDAARTLVGHYHSHGYSVVLLGNKVWAGWAREMKVADEVWDIDVTKFCNHPQYRWKWMSRIRQAGFRIAIQTAYSRVFLTGDSLVRASGAVERIGSTGGEIKIKMWFSSWSNRWYTHLIPASPIPMMELKRNAEFLRGLGISDFQARLPIIPQAASDQADRLLQYSYAVLVPAASWAGREWHIDNFIEVGRRLVDGGLKIVVVGVSADRERVRSLINKFPGMSVDLIGKTTLGELAEVLRHAAVLLTNETSTVHIGAAVGTPVVCIMGGGHFGRFVPYEIEATNENQELPITVVEPMPCYGCNWNCKYPRNNEEAVKCIKDISVEKVWVAMETAMANGREMIKTENERV
jgi:ADP-heptose:LPS heptosyltransferase